MSDCTFLTEQLVVILLTIFLLASLSKGLNYAFDRTGDAKRISLFVVGGIVFWLGILAVLAFQGVFADFSGLLPNILLSFSIPLILIILLLFSKKASEILKILPLKWLVLIQAFRIVMELFLWVGFKKGLVPFQMTFVGFNYDIIIGLTAPIAAFVFFRPGRIQKSAAVVWNIFGILILMSIMFIAVTSIPGDLRLFMNEPSNEFVAYFPFVWIPGFIVPFALAMHLFSLKQLFKGYLD